MYPLAQWLNQPPPRGDQAHGRTFTARNNQAIKVYQLFRLAYLNGSDA